MTGQWSGTVGEVSLNENSISGMAYLAHNPLAEIDAETISLRRLRRTSLYYDEFNQMVRMRSGPWEWSYIYTADGERIWQAKIGAAPRFDRWTLRDLDGKVLRIYERNLPSDSKSDDLIQD